MNCNQMVSKILWYHDTLISPITCLYFKIYVTIVPLPLPRRLLPQNIDESIKVKHEKKNNNISVENKSWDLIMIYLKYAYYIAMVINMFAKIE